MDEGRRNKNKIPSSVVCMPQNNLINFHKTIKFELNFGLMVLQSKQDFEIFNVMIVMIHTPHPHDIKYIRAIAVKLYYIPIYGNTKERERKNDGKKTETVFLFCAHNSQ